MPEGIALRPGQPGTLIEVAAWPDTAAMVAARLSALAGVPVPPQPGGAAERPSIAVVALAPGRWWVAGPPELGAEIRDAFRAGEAATADLTHGRALLWIEGGAALASLQKSVMLDLDPRIFPPGRVAQTSIHSIPVLLHRASAEAFALYAPSSYAADLLDWLREA